VTDANLHNVRIQDSNFLPIGHSGSGIRHIFGLPARHLNVPLVTGDATSLTETGKSATTLRAGCKVQWVQTKVDNTDWSDLGSVM
jgi:ATP-dependent protease Clp ATPase subunit